VIKATGLLLAAMASAAFGLQMSTVVVMDPCNVGEVSGEGADVYGHGSTRVCGAVDYVYEIGTYEVTAGQYCEFLNAVAAADYYTLYETYMWTNDKGPKIRRSGSWGSYTYAIDGDWSERPMNLVNWGDAVRFCNWMTNGQPIGTLTGDPNFDAALTEDGSYVLNGAVTSPAVDAATRKPDAVWVLPTEDEWYKAAYYKGGGNIAGYYDYATLSDTPPSNQVTVPDEGNNANFYVNYPVEYTIGAPYYRTEVGEFEWSFSAYRTYDQSGNVQEWTETREGTYGRVYRGGGWPNVHWGLHAGARNCDGVLQVGMDRGFRVARVPEPGTMGLLALGGLALLRRRWG